MAPTRITGFRDSVDSPVRIAVWSGPRNISTAMMRAWENRPDTVVCDEPLYAHYLVKTGADHPGRREVIASQPTDWRKVVAELTGPVPSGARVYYQKHMAHHLLPDMATDWVELLTNVFLIRTPREMLSSLVRVTPGVTVRDTGLLQQWRLYEALCSRAGTPPPPVIDARDVLEDPRGVLERLCRSVDVSFDEAMLSWPSGPRESDGVWAPHWYAAVEQTTGFQPYRPRPGAVPERLAPVLDECESIYRRLYAHRLRA